MLSANQVKKIAILPGDGIGVDVVQAMLPIFAVLNLPITWQLGDIGWDVWKREGEAIPERTWALINDCDALLVGATTSLPKREELYFANQDLPLTPYVSPIIQLRQKLDLFVNIRPCYSLIHQEKPFNFCILRENTEGLYAGFDYHPIPPALYPLLQAHPSWGQKDLTTCSVSLRLQSKAGLTRLFQYAFDYAKNNHFARVTFADKPNVLRESSAFARECFEAIASQYPSIQADILNVDAVALWLVKRPEEFGVIVAENMFGDILSDLGAGVMGGLGLAPSANVGHHAAYFEPVHGSAPRIPKNAANPSAMFLSCALLFAYLGFSEAAKSINRAVNHVIRSGKHLTYDLGGRATTEDMANEIIENLDAIL